VSVIHVNQIKNQVFKAFDGLIDISDVRNAQPEMRESLFLSRGLAAYAVQVVSGTTADDAAKSITDGADDNGLDALYYDEPNKRLYIVQSKWIRDGSGEPDNGEIKKFVAGVRDLFNLQFDRFNNKVRAKAAIVTQALNDPATRYEIVLAHTGNSSLSTHSRRDLHDLELEMNDPTEVVFVTVLHQAELHSSLTAGISGEPLNVEISLRAWGRKEAPHEAFYGQLSGDQVASLWLKHRARLFARNLRSMLGETDVNAEMRSTLDERPADFWYFNNGITILARSARRAMAGGGNTDFATFHCEDISVVNGAQTVGTIGKFGESKHEGLEGVFVPVRIIIRGENQYFGEEVTRTNNRQNRIENRDFVALDPEQSRIKTELAIDGIDYQLVRSESVSRSETAFDLVEATTALACASGTARLPVQLKREIGRLWEDLTKAPYKELFNASVPGLHVWRAVQIQRRIDRALDTFFKRGGTYRNYPIATHGNRLIAALVFLELPTANFRDPLFNIKESGSEDAITALVDERLAVLAAKVETHYPNAIIPTLFKNLKKCDQLFTEARTALVGSQRPANLDPTKA
jgi:hypothetical protein